MCIQLSARKSFLKVVYQQKRFIPAYRWWIFIRYMLFVNVFSTKYNFHCICQFYLYLFWNLRHFILWMINVRSALINCSKIIALIGIDFSMNSNMYVDDIDKDGGTVDRSELRHIQLHIHVYIWCQLDLYLELNEARCSANHIYPSDLPENCIYEFWPEQYCKEKSKYFRF